MEKIVIDILSRDETGKKARHLREQGYVPGVIYGHKVKPQAVKLERRLLERTYAAAGTNRILSVKIDKANSKNVLFQDVQHSPRTGSLEHFDLFVVKMDEKIKTEVPLHFTGESVAVYQQEGTLVKNLDTVEVEALPGDLPESFSVDIATLDDFEKTITVADLVVPEGVTVLNEADELVAKVEEPRTQDELAELEEPVEEVLPEEEGATEGAESSSDESKAEESAE